MNNKFMLHYHEFHRIDVKLKSDESVKLWSRIWLWWFEFWKEILLFWQEINLLSQLSVRACVCAHARVCVFVFAEPVYS